MVTMIAILIVAAILWTFIYFNNKESLNEGGTLNKSNIITFNCSSNFRNLFLKLEIDGSHLNGAVDYYIKNPDGDILDKGKISTSNSSVNVEKKFKGQKGSWKIEFKNITENEKISYKIDEVATNRNDNSHK